jgi:hypothetical protein
VAPARTTAALNFNFKFRAAFLICNRWLQPPVRMAYFKWLISYVY